MTCPKPSDEIIELAKEARNKEKRTKALKVGKVVVDLFQVIYPFRQKKSQSSSKIIFFVARLHFRTSF